MNASMLKTGAGAGEFSEFVGIAIGRVSLSV
jgi:hypothetical protein